MPEYWFEQEIVDVTIDPGRNGPQWREVVPGPVHFYRDGVEITEAEYRAGVGAEASGGT